MKRLKNLIDHDQEKILPYLIHDDQPSTFEGYGNYHLLVLRRLRLAENNLVLWSEVFLFLESGIQYFDRSNDCFVKLDGGEAELGNLLRGFYEGNQNVIAGYSDEIEDLEGSLFERDIPGHFMDHWFKIKRDLAKFENFYYRNLVVFHEFEKFFSRHKPESQIEMKDISESIGYQNASILTLKNRMDSLHHYYNSVKQDRLNKTIFTLTVISAIFLPMNLIVGFFGMNTEELFFKGDPQGTMKVVYVLASVTLFTLLGLRIIKALDQIFLRHLLGRFDYYKKISQRLEDIDNRLKGN